MEPTADLKKKRDGLFDKFEMEGVRPEVIRAMREVPREIFVPLAMRHLAYDDIPLGIGDGQTISQPFIVAVMTVAIKPRSSDRVLEIGTGSGYQAAVLSRIVKKVITVERIPRLVESSQQTLRQLAYTNVEIVHSGLALGRPREAPFDAIIVTAAAPRFPQELLHQVVLGGRIVVPVGDRISQDLLCVIRTEQGYSTESLGPCRFVPLIGRGGW